MLIRKLFRTMWQYKAQFISMIIMTMLGIGIFVGFNIEWYSIDVNTKAFFAETGFADFRAVYLGGFSSEDMPELEKLYGEKNITRYNEFIVNVENSNVGEDDKLSMITVENEDVSGFILQDGENYNSEDEDGIWISEKYAVANNVNLNDELEIFYNGVYLKGIVKGLIKSSEKLICIRDETQMMPDYSSFGYAYISPKMFEKNFGMQYYSQVHVIADIVKAEFSADIENLFGKEYMIISKDDVISYSGSRGEVNQGKVMGSVLPVVFLLISVLTMITTMQRIANKERSQIGTLKALGFKNRKILTHYSLYAVIIGIISSSLGLAFGFVIADFILDPDFSMGSYLDMPYWKLYMPNITYFVLFGIVILLFVIGLLSVNKILRKSACEILRPSNGEQIKPTKIEKTKWFHKLSFGARWNIRDALHNKIRTSMSLIGVIGCMTILVASFGINDTMNFYLENNYDGLMRYNNLLHLADDIKPEQLDSLLEKYKSDSASNIAVKIDDSTVALQIHSGKNNLVGFMDTNGDLVETLEDGAYICKRISDEWNIKTGDNLIIKTYQDDEEYTLKIAGVLSSMTKNIVISDKYAKDLDIPFIVNTIYVSENEVLMEDGIESIQSKEDLISTFDSILEIMRLMISILVVVGLVLSVVVLYNLGIMGYTERYREMATLKVLGFKDKKISKLLISQNLWLSVIGIIIGMPIGKFMLEYLLNALASEYEMIVNISSYSYIICILLNVGVSIFVSLLVSRKNKNIDMVEALKSNE